MPRSPRNSVRDSLVVAFMELVVDQDVSTISASDVCRKCGVHRTSFYRYFEDVDDLESRFLTLYLQKAFGGMLRLPQDAGEMTAVYEQLVGALVAHRRFFAQTMVEPRLLKYSICLKSHLEDWFRRQFNTPRDIVDPDLWELNLQFTLGTVFRLCEIVFRSKIDLDVKEMIRWMFEFLWGGRTYLVRALNDGGVPALSVLDQRLRLLVGEPAPSVS